MRHFILANSSPLCSHSSTSGSLTFRGTFTCRWTLKIAKHWRICSPSKWRTRVPVPHGSHILVPQRGDKRSLLDLAGNNAKQSYDQRFRVMKPNAKAIQEALQDALGLPELPRRIECFDISHIQGAETVASMVVWEDGQMKKSDYRKFIIRGVIGVDDFASMREVVTRRYKRIQEEKKTNAQPGADRRRARPVACRSRGARSARDHQPASGRDRQARRNYLRLRAGE